MSKHTVKLQGKEYVLFQGLLEIAHNDYGLESVDTNLIQVPTAENEYTAITKAVVKTKDGRTFSGIGDASPKSVNKMIAPHVIRMSETRAIGRALRFLTGFGTMLEELGGDIPEEPQHKVVTPDKSLEQCLPQLKNEGPITEQQFNTICDIMKDLNKFKIPNAEIKKQLQLEINTFNQLADLNQERAERAITFLDNWKTQQTLPKESKGA